MMNEELAVHEEEGGIMNGPGQEEESSVIPETVTDGYMKAC